MNPLRSITDRVAAYVFENEVTELYRMLSTGQPPVLPPVGLQFADFAVWQREHLKDEAVMAEHVAYWRARLADAPELSTLPPDRPRPAVQTPWGARRRIAGILSLRAVMYQAELDPAKTAGDYLKPALYIDGEMRLEAALKQMQRSGHRLGIVLGRDQREVGIVSLQDILKVIFGEVRL